MEWARLVMEALGPLLTATALVLGGALLDPAPGRLVRERFTHPITRHERSPR